VQFAIEFTQERALSIGHVANGVEVLAHLMCLLIVTSSLCVKRIGQDLRGLLETARGSMLGFSLREEVEGNHQKRVDGIV
jgi:hypothetical protein